MRKLLFLSVFIFGLLQSATVVAQDKGAAPKKDSLLPYQKYSTLPAFKILGMDSSTVFNTYEIPKGKATVLLFFGADCDHCKHLVEKLVAGMDSLKDVQFYMMSFSNPTPIKTFYNKFHLENFKNVKFVGKDTEFFFPSYFGARAVPYLAVYDKHKKFAKKFENDVTIKDLYKATRK